ncbi:MAG: DUF4393 domain-containing protein [Alphaproteobacteria bacterium]|nr:DUF4393 domain-containing protein [Alphaproteobacteria bacterium]
MTNELELFQLIQGGGKDLVQIVGTVKALDELHKWGGTAIVLVKGWVGKRQAENIKATAEKVQEKIKGIDSERLSEPSPSVAQPLIEAAMQESRPELQELWAGLLASAMLDDGKNARYEFKDILAKMSPQDAVVLGILRDMPEKHWRDISESKIEHYIVSALKDKGYDWFVFEASVRRLYELHCADPSSMVAKFPEERYRLRRPEVSSLGWLFLEAVNPH